MEVFDMGGYPFIDIEHWPFEHRGKVIPGEILYHNGCQQAVLGVDMAISGAPDHAATARESRTLWIARSRRIEGRDLIPGTYLVHGLRVGRHRHDGLIEIHRITPLTAVFSFLTISGETKEFGTSPQNLAQYICADQYIENLLLHDYEAEYNLADLPEQKRLAQAVLAGIKVSVDKHMKIPRILLDVKSLAGKCLARYLAEEQDNDVFQDLCE